uniref:ribosomal protein L32 n=1 Tax=Hydrocytium acuminatum TaxID=1745963 RepID=UPI002A81F1B1|nr:ribosomal protein L32 [Hydrocytium acuminatum]WOR09546.1 ribosomal protein L32 [Hydrocytium acuminatum]
MAVPKKRTSKSKKNIRHYAWKKKALQKATKTLFVARNILVELRKQLSEEASKQFIQNTENNTDTSNQTEKIKLNIEFPLVKTKINKK